MDGQRYIEVTQFGRSSRIPIIRPDSLAEVMRVEPSGGHSQGEYRPCQVQLNNGFVKDRVYIAEALSYIFYWGIWPEDDRAKSSISLLDVKHIIQSPTRLPAHLANKLYSGGETSMGGVSFALVLRDGRKISVTTGNAVDFPEYPPGVEASDVVDVIHDWKDPNQAYIGSAPYSWCLYCLEPEATKAIADGLPQRSVTWRTVP